VATIACYGREREAGERLDVAVERAVGERLGEKRRRKIRDIGISHQNIIEKYEISKRLYRLAYEKYQLKMANGGGARRASVLCSALTAWLGIGSFRVVVSAV